MTEVAADGTVLTPAPEKPAWISQLPDDLKGNETFTSFKTIGDLSKSYLDTMGKVKELDGITAKNKEYEAKLSTAIIKPGENAKPEEIATYRKAMGIPETSEEYEFPQTDGVENSPEMVKWAQGLFHKAGISKDTAAMIGQEWNAFLKGMVESEESETKKLTEENQAKFRGEFKTEDEYKVGLELAKRFWNEVTGKDDFDVAFKEAEAWSVPIFMRFIFNSAKLMGEDISPKGGQTTSGGVKIGIQYKDMEKFKGG